MEKEVIKKLERINIKLDDFIQTISLDALGRLKILQDNCDALQKRCDSLQEELNESMQGKDYKTCIQNYKESIIRKNEEINRLKEEIKTLKGENITLKGQSRRLLEQKVKETIKLEIEAKKAAEIKALKKEVDDLRKRGSTTQVLSSRLHNYEVEIRELKKENAALKNEKTNSEKVLELMKQVEKLKSENEVLKDILNDPDR
jgi:chromosome segregation ATPase